MPDLKDPVFPLGGVRVARVSTVPFFILAQLATQIRSLRALGAKVSVVSSAGPEVNAQNIVAREQWSVIDIPRSFEPLRDIFSLVHLFLFFRRERTQIAHSTTPKAGLITAIAALLAGVPIRLHTFTGQPWVNLSGFKRTVVRGCDRLIGQLNTMCYADSPSQRDFLIAEELLTPARLRVLGVGSLAGVDVDRFSMERFPHDRCVSLRAGLGIPINSPIIIFVGRITAEKGVREMLAAYGRLKSAGSKAHLVVVGEFDDEGGLPGIIRREELAAYRDLHVVGYTSSPESYMAIADVLCLPSYREGFGTVVIEAAAMGLSTVGTKIYGLTDAVVDGVTGLLVAPFDVEALEAALQRLLIDDILRKAMGHSARARACELFDSRTVNALLVDEYSSLLQQFSISPGSSS